MLFPILKTLRAEAAGGVDNAIFLFWPNGTASRAFRPGSYGAVFTGNYSLEPIMPFRDDIIIFDGTKTFDAGGGLHRSDLFMRGGGSVSLDTYLSAQRRTSVPALRMGVPDGGHPANTDYTTCSFTNSGSPIALTYDPQAAYNYAFGSFVFPQSFAPAALSSDPTIKLVQQKKSVIDYVLGDFNNMKRYLSSGELARFNEHFDLVRRIETTLAGQIGTSPGPTPAPAPSPTPVPTPAPAPAPAATCAKPTLLSNSRTLNLDRRIPLMLDIIVAAIACGRTDIGTLLMAEAYANNDYPFLTGRRTFLGSTNLSFSGVSHHGASHYLKRDMGDLTRFTLTQMEEMKAEIDKWHMEMLAYLINRLKAFGVFDNTVVLMGNELGEVRGTTDNHSYDYVSFLLAGGKGYFRTGQALDMKSAALRGYNSNSILSAVAHSLGHPTNWGGAGWSQGPLPAIVR